MEDQVRSQLAAITEKDDIIERLNAERTRKPPSKNEELKHFLRMIDTLNEENSQLREELDALKQRQLLIDDEGDKKGK